MTKNEFLAELECALSGLPEDDIREHISFYSEMIDDKIEDGIAEDEAVREIGSAKEIASQIISDIPFSRIVKEKVKKSPRPRALVIVLLILGFPVWFPLLIAAFSVLFSLIVSIWSIVISFWAVFASLAGCSIGGVIGGAVTMIFQSLSAGLVLLGGALVCAGLAILAFFGCKWLTKVTALLTKHTFIGIKKLFLK